MDTKIQPVISPRKRGPYRQHSTEVKRAVVAKSFVEGASVSRLAREFNINANQVFTWRRQFADLQGTVTEGARDEKVLGLEAQLNTRATEIEHQNLTIVKLRHMQFGRKSKKLDHQIEQLELQLEDLQADEAEAEWEMPEADRAPRRKSVRRPLPDHLSRDENIYAHGV